jgi:hypothetical protein
MNVIILVYIHSHSVTNKKKNFFPPFNCITISYSGQDEKSGKRNVKKTKFNYATLCHFLYLVIKN